MTKQHYPELDETLYRETLENGLTVLVVPRKGFTKKLAYFVTDFGSIHTDFRQRLYQLRHDGLLFFLHRPL